MVTFSNLYQKGAFEYTQEDNVIAKGNFTVDSEKRLVSMEATYLPDAGIANVFYDFNRDEPRYNITSNNIEDIITITSSIETIWNEVSESVKNIEEEQPDPDQGKKK